MMRRLMSLGVVLVLLSGVVALGATVVARAQSDVVERGHPIPNQGDGESVFTNATPELLAASTVLSSLPQPAALALQRVRIAPGGRTVTPGGDPRVVLVYVEHGTLTVTNSLAATVTRGAALATPGAQAQEAITAETEFTMRVGDSFFSPAGSGGELRNDGSEEVILLTSIIVPVPDGAATPWARTPVP
jgi:quercetin dioxygenase-like cupin family protein